MKTTKLTALFFGAIGAVCIAIIALPGDTSADPPGTIVGHVTARRASGRANAIVYIEEMPGPQSPPSRPAQIDQRGMRFLPQVLPIVRGTTVRFLNNDATEHNVYTPDGERYDLGNWTQGQSRDHVFDQLGVYTQLCRLHPTMIGYVVVLQNRFFALTRPDGSFRIENVPAGTYQLRAWQERGQGGPTPVTVAAGEVSVEIALGPRR